VLKAKLTLFAVIGVIAILIAFFILEVKQVASSEITSWTTDHRADCAIVLTGAPGRVHEGFDLLSQKQIKKLILAGVYPKAKLREIFPQWPFYGVLDEKDVVLERRSETTYGNAQQALILVEALQCRNVILITSRLHMHRAFKTFQAIFPERIPIYARSVIWGTQESGIIDLLMESIKSFFYSLWAY